MSNKLKFYQLDVDYAKFINKNLENTADTSSTNKITRKYLGIIIMQGSNEYLIPMGSPKPKHKNMKNTIDFIKINNGEYGVINLNNMIPVNKTVYKLVNFSDVKNFDYKTLLEKQYQWINKEINKEKIIKKAKTLYNKYKENTLPENIKKRCVNFEKAEKILNRYIRSHSNDLQR